MVLYLLPNLLGEKADPSLNFISGLSSVVNGLDGFFVETPKKARLFLSHFDFAELKKKPMVEIAKEFDKESLEPLLRGEKWGVITDQGLACIVDPGAKIVAHAKKKGIEVIAYPGPCSFVLALMLSGIECQQFSFQGYMPREIDRHIRKKGVQIFIETPYKSQATLEKIIEVLKDEDLLCVAADLTLPSQVVITTTVKSWRVEIRKHNFHKRPCIFILKSL